MKSLRLIALAIVISTVIVAFTSVQVAGAYRPVFHDLDAPHEEAALDFLHRAEQHLQQCKINAGGYCTQALNTVRSSIQQVEAALKASDGQIPAKSDQGKKKKSSAAKNPGQ